nr:MAG TPA: hypothetical protein [Caudoviricetes sp.]
MLQIVRPLHRAGKALAVTAAAGGRAEILCGMSGSSSCFFQPVTELFQQLLGIPVPPEPCLFLFVGHWASSSHINHHGGKCPK